jgi:hypothetical protein
MTPELHLSQTVLARKSTAIVIGKREIEISKTA